MPKLFPTFKPYCHLGIFIFPVSWFFFFFFLILIYCAIRKNPMLHINKYFFNQGGALRQVWRWSHPQTASDPRPPTDVAVENEQASISMLFLGSNSLVSEQRGALVVSTKCCGRQACSELREGECGATWGQVQLIRLCLEEGVGRCSVEGLALGRVRHYVLAESRPEGASDQ